MLIITVFCRLCESSYITSSHCTDETIHQLIISKMTDSQDKVTFYIKNRSSAASGKGQREEIKIENFKIKQDLSEPQLKS